MKLSTVSLVFLATSAAAVAVPDTSDQVARDNHSPVAPPDDHAPVDSRASFSVNFAELEAQVAQAERDIQVLRDLGEHEAAERKARYAAQLKAQLQAYQDAEQNNGGIWDRLKRQLNQAEGPRNTGDIDERGRFKGNIDDEEFDKRQAVKEEQRGPDKEKLVRQITLLQRQARQLRVLGRREDAARKDAEIERLKRLLRGQKKRQTTINFEDIARRIAQLESELRQLQALGEVEAARRKIAEIERLKGLLENAQGRGQLKGKKLPDRGRRDSLDDELEERASITVNFAEVQARIRKLEQELRILQSLGEAEAAERKAKEIQKLKGSAETFADAEANNRNRFGGRDLNARDDHVTSDENTPREFDEQLQARDPVQVDVKKLKAKIRREENKYNQLRELGEHAAAKRKLRYINGLKAKLRAYEEADSNAGGGFKRGLGEFEVVGDLARMA